MFDPSDPRILRQLAALTDDELVELAASLPPEHAATLAALDTTSSHHSSTLELLPHQKPPPEGWDGWVLTGGRGVGKTLAGANWIANLARTTPGLRGRIIAPTLADAVNGVVQDPDSGILAADPTAVYRPSGAEGTRVTWPNGSTVWCVGTSSPRDVDRLRALTNIDADLYEEAAANPNLAQAVQQANLSRRGSRLPKPLWIATTTPRPLPQIKTWLDDPTVAVTRATTFDNPHTPDAYRAHAEALKGTRLYRQEVLGEILDDIEGALWVQADLDRSRLTPEERADLLSTLTRCVVGVDPPAGSGTCGIVVAGVDPAGIVYVLDDYSRTDVSPHEWATAASAAAREYDALVVAEVNQGGRMVTEVLRAAAPDLPVTTVNAAKGKQTRAEPIALLWEAEHQSARLAGADNAALAKLEDQMCSWIPGTFSPDRVDALVWACTYLRGRASHVGSVTVPGRVTRLPGRNRSPLTSRSIGPRKYG